MDGRKDIDRERGTKQTFCTHGICVGLVWFGLVWSVFWFLLVSENTRTHPSSSLDVRIRQVWMDLDIHPESKVDLLRFPDSEKRNMHENRKACGLESFLCG